MTTDSYYAPRGGLPPQTQLTTDRAVFTQAYAVLPRGTMTDIVTSLLPFWDKTRLWVIARPLSGFAETFSQYIVEVSPGGGSDKPELDPGAEGVLFVVDGALELKLDEQTHQLAAGGYAFIPPGAQWTLHNTASQNATFHWIRKAYQKVQGIEVPPAFVTSDRDVEGGAMPDTDGAWITQRFADPGDIRHDMHVNIVTFEPGGVIPFPETHGDGTRPVRAGGQGRLPAEQRLGRGPGRRLHVASGLLSPGLLRRRPGQVPLPALQGRQSSRIAQPSVRLSQHLTPTLCRWRRGVRPVPT